MAVMNATNDSSIFRLKKTWGRLSPQARDLWHALKKYTEKGARFDDDPCDDSHTFDLCS